MPKNSLILEKKAESRAARFDFDDYKPNKESLKVFNELNAVALEIEECRKRNLEF